MSIKDRGFASMLPERLRQIASKGGKAAHASGKAHRWTSEEAAKAGRIGGTNRHQRLLEKQRETR